MDLRFSSFNFPQTEDTGPQRAQAQLSFARRVRQVAVGLTGYSATFQNRDDHHLGFLTVELDATVNSGDATKVDVGGVFGLRDWSGEWDDPYSGIVEFAVFADLEPATPPAPGASRGDLIVVDAEINQAIQHFRSFRHLDAANVLPDNSVRLVAAKPTAVRLYVDYDASSGLAPIAQLSGQLGVTAGGVTTSLTPLRAIVPRRDGSIDRGQRDHTLNFVIPENLCLGTVEIVARVFSASDGTQFSADFARTLVFETMPALPIMAIGIEYAGKDVRDPLALAAPTMADFVSVFGLTEALYPIPNIAISSFLTMRYDKDIKSDINEGCDKFNDLNDALSDMRGDSDDVVFGMYNSGVETGSVGGCGGSGVATGRIGSQGTAAHEVAHALGRRHAPCDNVTRCATPLDTDDDYPVYAGFDSDSIGEYGFDTRSAAGLVLNPSTAHDVMGYSGNRWISPYTYKALMSRIPQAFGATAAARQASGAEIATATARPPLPRGRWIPIKQPQLFLRLDIARDRSVQMQASFWFDARPRPVGDRRTDFGVEFLDAKGQVLRHARLYAGGAGCGCGCADTTWPLRIRQALAFDPNARTMVLYECDKPVQQWPIGEPPKVELSVRGHDEPKARQLDLGWKVSGAEAGAGGRWFLVHWRDAHGTWRGVAPRTQAQRMEVPKHLFGKSGLVVLRVLACDGLATGQAGWEGRLDRATDRPSGNAGASDVVLAGVDLKARGALALPGLLRATVFDATGASLRAGSLRWFDAHRAELARGRTLNLESLPVGQHQITLAAPHLAATTATWLIERRRDGRFLLLAGDQKTRPSSHPEELKPETRPED